MSQGRDALIETFIAQAGTDAGAPVELQREAAMELQKLRAELDSLRTESGPKKRGRKTGRKMLPATHAKIRAAAAFLMGRWPLGPNLSRISPEGNIALQMLFPEHKQEAIKKIRNCRNLLLIPPQIKTDEKGEYLRLVLEGPDEGEGETKNYEGLRSCRFYKNDMRKLLKASPVPFPEREFK